MVQLTEHQRKKEKEKRKKGVREYSDEVNRADVYNSIYNEHNLVSMI